MRQRRSSANADALDILLCLPVQDVDSDSQPLPNAALGHGDDAATAAASSIHTRLPAPEVQPMAGAAAPPPYTPPPPPDFPPEREAQPVDGVDSSAPQPWLQRASAGSFGFDALLADLGVTAADGDAGGGGGGGASIAGSARARHGTPRGDAGSAAKSDLATDDAATAASFSSTPWWSSRPLTPIAPPHAGAAASARARGVAQTAMAASAALHHRAAAPPPTHVLAPAAARGRSLSVVGTGAGPAPWLQRPTGLAQPPPVMLPRPPLLTPTVAHEAHEAHEARMARAAPLPPLKRGRRSHSVGDEPAPPYRRRIISVSISGSGASPSHLMSAPLSSPLALRSLARQRCETPTSAHSAFAGSSAGGTVCRAWRADARRGHADLFSPSFALVRPLLAWPAAPARMIEQVKSTLAEDARLPAPVVQPGGAATAFAPTDARVAGFLFA